MLCDQADACSRGRNAPDLKSPMSHMDQVSGLYPEMAGGSSQKIRIFQMSEQPGSQASMPGLGDDA
jgi:hypothetical protein